MPTSIPAEVQTLLDNGALLIGSIGIATLVVILTVSVFRYIRGIA